MIVYRQTTKTAGEIISEVSTILKDSANDIWSEEEKLQSLNDAISALYPEVVKPVIDTSLTTVANTLEYDIPAGIDRIEIVGIKESGYDNYYSTGFVLKLDSSSSKLALKEYYSEGLTIQLVGGAKIPEVEATTDNLDISADSEILLKTGLKLELYNTVLLDKGKMNQFSARETETTEVDVMNMIDRLNKKYDKLKEEAQNNFVSLLSRV